jgi:hypothetical protein
MIAFGDDPDYAPLMTQDSPSRRQDQFVIRMPDGLRERIAEAAKDQGRSMNAEIVMTLEMTYPPTPPPEEIVPILEGVLRMSQAGKVRNQWNQLYSLLREFHARLEAETKNESESKS